MKTNLLAVSLLAAAAIAALLVSPIVTCAAFVLAGLIAVFAGDYRSDRRLAAIAA